MNYKIDLFNPYSFYSHFCTYTPKILPECYYSINDVYSELQNTYIHVYMFVTYTHISVILHSLLKMRGPAKMSSH